MSCGTVSGVATNASSRIRVPPPNPKFTTRIPYPLSRCYFFQVNFGGNQQLSIITPRRSSPNAASLDLPLLPFNATEVLVPSETKTLHLYEARYLALLEEVERLDIRALVSIRGIGRVKIVKFLQSDPFLIGEVIPMQDRILRGASNINSKATAIKEALYSLNSLEIKLKAPKEALLQTHVANSLTWAEKELSLECDKAFIPSLAERISFTALQPITGSTQSELLKLLQLKLKAMEMKDTLQRLDDSVELVKENISLVAAKLAIQ